MAKRKTTPKPRGAAAIQTVETSDVASGTNKGRKGRGDGPNKSEMIRAELEASPKASPAEIVETLKGKGLEVSPTLVSNVKSRWEAGKGKTPGKRGRKAGVKRAEANGHTSGADVFSLACDFVSAAGGLPAAIAKLQKLQG